MISYKIGVPLLLSLWQMSISRLCEYCLMASALNLIVIAFFCLAGTMPLIPETRNGPSSNSPPSSTFLSFLSSLSFLSKSSLRYSTPCLPCSKIWYSKSNTPLFSISKTFSLSVDVSSGPKSMPWFGRMVYLEKTASRCILIGNAGCLSFVSGSRISSLMSVALLMTVSFLALADSLNSWRPPDGMSPLLGSMTSPASTNLRFLRSFMRNSKVTGYLPSLVTANERSIGWFTFTTPKSMPSWPSGHSGLTFIMKPSATRDRSISFVSNTFSLSWNSTLKSTWICFSSRASKSTTNVCLDIGLITPVIAGLKWKNFSRSSLASSSSGSLISQRIGSFDGFRRVICCESTWPTRSRENSNFSVESSSFGAAPSHSRLKTTGIGLSTIVHTRESR
mmetsp:Transcript_13969/g.28244  ORF Transcript_13969/g.28244 Transcript_13969/m.28244 type:complete len:392 (-) Transcript_13969:1720-2895(-)